MSSAARQPVLVSGGSSGLGGEAGAQVRIDVQIQQ